MIGCSLMENVTSLKYFKNVPANNLKKRKQH